MPVLWLILLLGAGAQILSWSNGHNWGDDFAGYILQAKSLVDGSIQEYFRRNAFTIHESSVPVGPIAYPWGFPILLALLEPWFGLHLLAFKALVLFFLLGFLVVLWFLFQKELPTAERALFLSLFAFNPFFLEFGDNVLSDTPFLFFSTLSMFIFSRLHETKSLAASYGLAAGLGLSFAAATAIRPNGVLLPLTYGLMGLWFYGRKLRPFGPTVDLAWFSVAKSPAPHRYFVHAIPLAVFAGAIGVLNHYIPDDASVQLSQIKGVDLKTIYDNTRYYGLLSKDFFGLPPLNLLLYLMSLPFLFLGLRKTWRSFPAILIYAGLTLGLYILLPFWQGLRYIFPILPFYLFFVFVGLGQMDTSGSRFHPSRRTILAVLLLFLASQSFWLLSRNLVSGGARSDGPYTQDAQAMFEFIREKVPKDEVVVFFKPRAMRLFTDRDSLLYEKIGDFKVRQWYVIDKKNPTPADRAKESLFAAHPALLQYENSQFQVYRFQQAATSY